MRVVLELNYSGNWVCGYLAIQIRKLPTKMEGEFYCFVDCCSHAVENDLIVFGEDF